MPIEQITIKRMIFPEAIIGKMTGIDKERSYVKILLVKKKFGLKWQFPQTLAFEETDCNYIVSNDAFVSRGDSNERNRYEKKKKTYLRITVCKMMQCYMGSDRIGKKKRKVTQITYLHSGKYLIPQTNKQTNKKQFVISIWHSWLGLQNIPTAYL